MLGSIGEIKRFIENGASFTLVSHTSPDGDTLGSALALMRLIRALGKTAEVVCCDPVPEVYRFLPGADEYKTPESAAGYNCVIAVDCADKLRLGSAGTLFENAFYTAQADHHGTNAGYAQANAVNANAAACGELIFCLFESFGLKPDKNAATCLFAALMTDTGCFAYSNVTPDTMRIAGELIDCGADNAEINMLIYRTVPVCKTLLHAHALNGLKLYAQGRIAMAALSQEEIAACGAKDEHCDGIVESLRDISTVEIAVFLRQSGENVKASLRAKRTANVSNIAAKKNGGGHARAAGYTEHGCTLDAAYQNALALAKEELEK